MKTEIRPTRRPACARRMRATDATTPEKVVHLSLSSRTLSPASARPDRRVKNRTRAFCLRVPPRRVRHAAGVTVRGARVSGRAAAGVFRYFHPSTDVSRSSDTYPSARPIYLPARPPTRPAGRYRFYRIRSVYSRFSYRRCYRRPPTAYLRPRENR